MMISKKFVKYLNNIIHHTYFNTIYNSDEQKQNIIQNIYNILKTNIPPDNITTICTYELRTIINNEIRYYFDTKHKEIENKDNYVDLFFNQFIELYRKSITLNTLFVDIYQSVPLGVLGEHYRITDMFLNAWDSIILNNVFYIITESIINYIYHQNLPHMNLENIIYVLKSKFNKRFSSLLITIKHYRTKYYHFKDTYTLETYIQHFLEYTKHENELEVEYSFYSYIDFKDELVQLFFTNNFYKIKKMYIISLEQDNIEDIRLSDSYLYRYLYDDYTQLIEVVVLYIVNNTSELCSFKKYILIYNKIRDMYSIDTFKNIAEPLINKQFEFIKTETDKEPKLMAFILEDLKQTRLSEYTKLLEFVDTSVFMASYIKYLCKRIINSKINIKTELEYFREFKKYNIEELYKIEMMLCDVALNRSLNNEITFCNTNLTTGRYMIWPLKKREMLVPKSFQENFTTIKLWYGTKFPNRILYFNTSLLRCDIMFNGYKLNIKGCYADILLKFNTCNSIKQTNIDVDMGPFIKLKIINKKEEYYHINDNFYSKYHSIKIN